MKKLTICTVLSCLAFSFSVSAQTPRKVIIEHFTNTYCSICASKNPTFYNTLEDYADVLHIAYHPSSPYPQCYFNQQNEEENDARTTYYSVYGSTPRIVIEGKAISSSTPLLNTAVLDTFLNKNAAFSIEVNQVMLNMDSMTVEIKVKRVAVSDATSLAIYGAVSEDTIYYSAANGEDVHYDVFRKQLFPAEGASIDLPNIGDSVLLTSGYQINSSWDVNLLSANVMIHDAATKKILNMERASDYSVASGIPEGGAPAQIFSIVSNPVNEVLHLVVSKTVTQIEILNAVGQKQITRAPAGETELVDVTGLPAGVYFVVATTPEGFYSQKFLRQ